MSDVVKHLFQSEQLDGSEATLVQPSNWNEEHVFAGGSDGQALSRDSGQSDGAAWGWFIPATPITSDDDIPIGQARIVRSEEAPITTALRYRVDASTVISLAERVEE